MSSGLSGLGEASISMPEMLRNRRELINTARSPARRLRGGGLREGLDLDELDVVELDVAEILGGRRSARRRLSRGGLRGLRLRLGGCCRLGYRLGRARALVRGGRGRLVQRWFEPFALLTHSSSPFAMIPLPPILP